VGLGSAEQPRGIRVEVKVELEVGEGESPVTVVLSIAEEEPQELQDTGARLHPPTLPR